MSAPKKVVLSNSTIRLATALQECFQEATQIGREEFRAELRAEMTELRTEMAELRTHVDARLDAQDELLRTIVNNAKPNGQSPV